MKVQIKTDDQTRQDVLVIDDRPMFCPYKAPIPVPNQLNGVSIMNFPCSTNCPLMKIDQKVIALHCGSEKIIYNMTEMVKMSKI